MPGTNKQKISNLMILLHAAINPRHTVNSEEDGYATMDVI